MCFVLIKDVLVLLPMGSEKSLSYALLPWIFDKLWQTSALSISVVATDMGIPAAV